MARSSTVSFSIRWRTASDPANAFVAAFSTAIASFSSEAAAFATRLASVTTSLAALRSASSAATSGTAPVSWSALSLVALASRRDAFRASSTGRIPSRRSAISLRRPGVTSENASSCFCSAYTEARKTWRSMWRRRRISASTSVVPVASVMPPPNSSAPGVWPFPLIVRRTS